MTVGFLLDDARAARMIEQHALDPTLPGLDAVIDQLVTATFGAETASPYEAEISRAVQRVVVEHLMTLAANADMPQVRAIATLKLQQRMQRMTSAPTTGAAAQAHGTLLAADIKRFLDRPMAPAARMEIPAVPPGAPIGEPGMDWLRRVEPWCGEWK
jgi:hypothetical protein